MYKLTFTSKESFAMFIELLEKENLNHFAEKWSERYNSAQIFPLTLFFDLATFDFVEENDNYTFSSFIFRKGTRQVRNEQRNLVSETIFLDSDPTFWDVLYQWKAIA